MLEASTILVLMDVRGTFNASSTIFQSGPKWPFRTFKLFASHVSICGEPFFTAATYSRGEGELFFTSDLHPCALRCFHSFALDFISDLLEANFVTFE
jgi:hypothetical protein